MKATPATVAASPAWHLHRLDLAGDRGLLLEVDEDLLRNAIFLDQRIEPEVRGGFWHPRERINGLFAECHPPPSSPALIFHLGHCGSTLLARALGASATVLPLREPLVLRDLAVARRAAPDDDAWEAHAGLVLRALGRSFHHDQSPLVKATSICSNLAPALLTHGPQRHALLMWVTLADHLANMLGRSQRTTDLAGFRVQREADWRRITGGAPGWLDPDDDVRLAVLAWLVGMHDLTAAREAAPGRAHWLRFDDLLADPGGRLAETADALLLDADPLALAAAWPGIVRGYSKQPETPFAPADRDRRLARARQRRGAELAAGLDLARRLCDRHALLAPLGDRLA